MTIYQHNCRYENSVFCLDWSIVIIFSQYDIKIEENKTYSWDLKRQNMDKSKFIIEDVQNTEVGRIPGEINGKYLFYSQIIFQNVECYVNW